MERWSYKPEVEGLSPSLGTNLLSKVQGPKSNVNLARRTLDFGRATLDCLMGL